MHCLPSMKYPCGYSPEARELTSEEIDEIIFQELDRLFIKIYEDNAKGKLSDNRFAMMREPTRTSRRS